jgi:hypothetical protein
MRRVVIQTSVRNQAAGSALDFFCGGMKLSGPISIGFQDVPTLGWFGHGGNTEPEAITISAPQQVLSKTPNNVFFSPF